MQQLLIQDKHFDKLNFRVASLDKAEYENCKFSNCDFSGSNFSDIKFIDCEFKSCNLSLVKLIKTVFRDVTFKDCKLLGLLFENCNPFGFALSFNNCNLTHASFFKLEMKKANFENSKLQEVDFSECNLTAAVFGNCDFLNAKFENTILEKADLRSSYNYLIDPNINRIKKAKFSLTELPGLLYKHDIEVDRGH